jgi:hypothetical protein
VAEAFQLAGTRLGHVAHAFAGIDPRDSASPNAKQLSEPQIFT